MGAHLVQREYTSEVILLRLAREIAKDINPLETILKHQGISTEQWEDLKSSPTFLTLLESEVQAWNAAGNASERVRIKSGAIIEEALPRLYSDLHSDAHTLTARNELLKTLSKLAGMGEKTETAASGERFSVTINLGNDTQLKFEKEVKTIDAEVIDG